MKNFAKFIFIVSLLVSCTQDNNKVDVDSSSAEQLKESYVANSQGVNDLNASPENLDNEFDYVGQIHNQALIELLLNYEGSTDIQDVLTESEEVLMSNSYYNDLLDGSQHPQFTVNQVEDVVLDFSNDFENYINATNLSRDAKLELNDFVSTTLNYNDSYEDYYSYVTNFESDIISSNLSESEKEIFLTTTSVARYSGHLWNTVITQEPDDDDDPTGGGNKEGTWVVVGADVIGGAAGAVAGSATVAGGIAGGISGASSASSLAARFVDAQVIYEPELELYEAEFTDDYVVVID